MKVILVSAASVDGKIATSSKDPIKWTSKADKSFFAQKTKQAGVVLMGSHTHQAIGKPLSGRLNIVFTSSPEKHKKQIGVEFTSRPPPEVIRDLKNKGFKKVMLIGGSKLNSSFLKSKLIDEIWLTIEGIILGGSLSLFEELKYQVPVELISFDKIGRDGILVKYRVLKAYDPN